MIVERKDGSLWMLARTSKGIMQTTSRDGGRTWAEPTEPPGIRQPNARFHIRRLASGKLLLVKHGDRIDQHEGRVQLSAWLSEDDGKSWKGGLVLDERKGVSYPDGFQAPDGTIFISYDRNRATDGEILLARFTEEDIPAKKLVGSKSKLKMLISRPLGIKKDAAKPKATASGDVPMTVPVRAVAIDARLQADDNPPGLGEHSGTPIKWVKRPELTFDEMAKKWHVTFELESLSDVEVAIVDPKSTVIRHLAAGVLGPKAPPPFAANSRHQKLEWDGADD